MDAAPFAIDLTESEVSCAGRNRSSSTRSRSRRDRAGSGERARDQRRSTGRGRGMGRGRGRGRSSHQQGYVGDDDAENDTDDDEGLSDDDLYGDYGDDEYDEEEEEAGGGHGVDRRHRPGPVSRAVLRMPAVHFRSGSLLCPALQGPGRGRQGTPGISNQDNNGNRRRIPTGPAAPFAFSWAPSSPAALPRAGVRTGGHPSSSSSRRLAFGDQETSVVNVGGTGERLQSLNGPRTGATPV